MYTLENKHTSPIYRYIKVRPGADAHQEDLAGASLYIGSSAEAYDNLKETYPVILHAGVGTASDATVAMELGADGVLMNTAIAEAQDAVLMAEAMKLAVEAGRAAYLAGRIPKKLYASASSPVAGVVR